MKVGFAGARRQVNLRSFTCDLPLATLIFIVYRRAAARTAYVRSYEDLSKFDECGPSLI